MKHPKSIHGSVQYFGRGNPFPEPPSRDNTFGSPAEAKQAYRNAAIDSGHDYILHNGYGGGPACWMDLFDAEGWDGTSYGDPYARLVFKTDRLGIHVESF